MKNILYIILILTLVSCGDSVDIEEDYTHRYASIVTDYIGTENIYELINAKPSLFDGCFDVVERKILCDDIEELITKINRYTTNNNLYEVDVLKSETNKYIEKIDLHLSSKYVYTIELIVKYIPINKVINPSTSYLEYLKKHNTILKTECEEANIIYWVVDKHNVEVIPIYYDAFKNTTCGIAHHREYVLLLKSKLTYYKENVLI